LPRRWWISCELYPELALTLSIAVMARGERDLLERAVRAVTEQAAKADELVDEAIRRFIRS